jgi:hypothetical protein
MQETHPDRAKRVPAAAHDNGDAVTFERPGIEVMYASNAQPIAIDATRHGVT